MKRFDIFGSQIKFRFQGQKSYTTSLGLFFTFMIACVIILRFVILLNEIYTRVDPVVLYKERQVDSPKKFVMNNFTFPFAFGMQDQTTQNHYIDPSIYRVVAFQNTKTTVYDEKGQPQVLFKQTNAIVQRCSQDNFQNPNTQDSFLKLPFLNLYCIHPEFQEVMEGDYSQPDFQHFVIQIFPCTGQGCGDTATLGKGFFAIYFQDAIVSPDNKDEPFKFYNRDLFWITSTSSPREITMYFRNNYIESDYGWVTSDVETVRHISYSNQDVSFTSETDYFVQLVMRFEKQRESVYSRKYKNLTNVISEIGGFTQSMLAIGFIICTTLSDLMLSKSIINDQFNFKISTINENAKNNQHKEHLKSLQISLSNNDQSKKANQNDNLRQVIKDSFSEIKQKDKQININEKNHIKHDFSSFNNQYLHSIEQLPKKSKEQNLPSKPKSIATLNSIIKRKSTTQPAENQIINEIKSYQSQKDKTGKSPMQTKSANPKIENQQFKKLLNQETSSMEFSIIDYIKYFFWPFGEIKKKKKMIDYSIQKLYYHLDVIYIVKKLLEVDKLKQLIMDQDQIQLFEYISKPVISEEEVFGVQDKNNQKKQNEKYSILYEDNRSEKQKIQEAYISYQNIVNRNDLSILDKKILNHLDPHLLTLFDDKQNDQADQNSQVQNTQNVTATYNNMSIFHNLNNEQRQDGDKNISLFQNQFSITQIPQNINPTSEEQSNFFDNINLDEQTPHEIINPQKLVNYEMDLSKNQMNFQY